MTAEIVADAQKQAPRRDERTYEVKPNRQSDFQLAALEFQRFAEQFHAFAAECKAP